MFPGTQPGFSTQGIFHQHEHRARTRRLEQHLDHLIHRGRHVFVQHHREDHAAGQFPPGVGEAPGTLAGQAAPGADVAGSAGAPIVLPWYVAWLPGILGSGSPGAAALLFAGLLLLLLALPTLDRRLIRGKGGA